MTAPDPSVHAIVVADDGVEAGMLALDLVQAGFDAHAASDEDSAMAQLRSLLAARVDLPAVISAYQDLRRTSVLSRRLVSAGLSCRFVAVVGDRDRSTAQAESALLDWLAVVDRPPNIEAIVRLLRDDGGSAVPTAAPVGQTTEGSLADTSASELLARLIEDSVHEHRRDAVLQLAAQQRAGQIALINGEIVHAQADDDAGRHALERICCWRQGDWRITYTRYVGQRTLHDASPGLLAAAVEYARRVATARESVPNRNAVCTVRWERVRPLPVVAEAMFHRIASGALLERAIDGAGDDELEAFAALVSRIRRGAVVPQESPVLTQRQTGQRYSRVPDQEKTGTFGHQQAYPMVPDMHVAAPEQMGVRPKVQHTAGYEAVAHAPGPAGVLPSVVSTASTGNTVRLGSGASPALTPVASASPLTPVSTDGVLTRRIDTTDLPMDLPAAPVGGRPRHATPSGPILPARLPDYEQESDTHALPSVGRPVAVEPSAAATSTGWFGLNVGTGHGEQNRGAVRAIVPQAPAAPPPPPAPKARESGAHQAAPRARKATAEIDSTYSSWSGEFAPTDAAIEEVSATFRLVDLEAAAPRAGVGKWVAAAVLVVLTGVGAWMWWPAGTEDVGAQEPPVMQTYRRAVTLVDDGRAAEAMALLTGLHDNKTIPAEALLQLGVLEVEHERYLLGRSHLERYLDDPRARHTVAARRLYEHVFGRRPAQE